MPHTDLPDTALLDLLTGLVAVDSVNPGLDPTGPGEAAIAAYVLEWARAHGLAAELAGDPARPSVLIRTTATSAGPTLLLCGHLDTVGHGTMSDPTRPRIESGRMYGRGTYDMKGGLAAALVAAARLNDPGHHGSVVVAAVADEEHLSTGAEAVLDEVTADAAIVTEPTELIVTVAHRGFVWVEVVIDGVAAHGSRPQLGVDAIVAAGPVLTGLADLQRRLAEVVHPDLGPGTVHASFIHGGTEESTIPDRCTLVIERRTIPGERVDDVVTEIEQLLDTARSRTPGARFTARAIFDRDPMETLRDEPIVTAAQAARTQVIGTETACGGGSYWADSALITARGIPTILLGPAGEGAHAEVEWVDLESVCVTARILEETARRLASALPRHE